MVCFKNRNSHENKYSLIVMAKWLRNKCTTKLFTQPITVTDMNKNDTSLVFFRVMSYKDNISEIF